DNDWKVREASYKAMQQLVLRVQKEIAPYLKQLIPIWLISLFDSCPPAACAAMNSFNSVFPLKKQAEVFNFCKTEIFNVKTLSKAAQTSTTKNSENDTDEKQIRATVGSLKVLNLVLAKVDSENSKEFIHSLLSEEQFWKLCKHQNEEVRASWYRFKSTICENFPEIIRQHSVVACRTTFNYISESDPLISVEIWANILSLIRVLDDWWKHINLHNSFLHQLKILMRKKAHIASTFFPSLLPILKHLPSDALKDYNKFTIELFESFMESLRNTENLPTDFKYVVVSYFQCAHYFAFDAEIANQDDKNKLFIFLIDNQVKNILMRFLKENKFKKRNNIFYTELMKFANRLEAVPEKQEKLGNCILEVCLTILRNAVNQIEFLSGLTSFMNDAKRLFNDKEIRNVQFFGAKETEPVIDVLQKKFPHFYESLLINILCESLKLKSEDTEWITFIFNLTEVFNCLLFLNEKDSSALKLFVQEFLMQTITKEPDIKKQKNIQIIIDLMFKIYDVSEEKSKSFNELLIIKDPLVREQVVKNIANRNQKDKFISNWTESEEAIEFIFNLAKDLVDRIHSRNESTKLEWNALWNSLILFFGLHNVNTKCLNKVIKLFEEVIRSNKASNEIVSFVCEVTENIFILYKPCETLLSMKDLLLLFFKLSCEKSHLKEKLVPVWAKGVELICGNTGAYASDNSLISLIANEIHQMLNGQIKDEEKYVLTIIHFFKSFSFRALMVSDNIHTFLNIINNYSLSIEQENSFMSTLILDETLALILNQILLSDKEWGNLTLTLDKNFLLKLWYDGTLSVFPEIFKVAEINTDPHPVVFSSLVTARILNSLTFETTNCPNFTNFFPSILHTCTIYSYFKIFSSVLSYKRIVKIDQIFPTFHKQYELITKKYCGYLKDEMTIQLFNLSRKNGLLYGLALNDLLQILETSLSISSDSLTLDKLIFCSIRSPPPALLSTLCQTDQFMEAMLCDFRVGDCCCIVDPTTDAHHYSLAYLFTWCQIFEYFSFLTPENRSLLSGYLNESGTLFKLLNNVFRLMPIHEDADTDPRSMILTSFDFHAAEPPSSREIQHMSSQVYIMALRKMPASIRLWLSNQDKRVVDVVNQFTTNYASNFLSSEELKSIQASSLSSFKNLTVKARPTAREVTALYSVEDMSIELTIQFPLNYPLSPVTIDSGKRVGVTSSQWRTWLLQLTTFLTHQNGSIIDALLLWKKNIDKRFEGVEECMICFYILHGSTCQLPKLSCKHCKKKYHSACLYKWFKTSNNATCPLCRNLF
ncbi:RNF160 protein-like protein, partial [Dinothrombium tinctorium]